MTGAPLLATQTTAEPCERRPSLGSGARIHRRRATYDPAVGYQACQKNNAELLAGSVPCLGPRGARAGTSPFLGTSAFECERLYVMNGDRKSYESSACPRSLKHMRNRLVVHQCLDDIADHELGLIFDVFSAHAGYITTCGAFESVRRTIERHAIDRNLDF